MAYDSAARAILPQVVDRRKLDTTDSCLTIEETVGQDFGGPPVGAALFGWFRAAPLLANAARLRAGRPPRARRPWSDPGGAHRAYDPARGHPRGLRWLWRHPALRELTIFSGLIAALMSMATSLTVLHALDTLYLTPSLYGILFITMGIGGLVGSAAVRPLTAHVGRPRMMALTAAIGAVMFVLLGTIASRWAAGLWLFGLSAGLMIWNVLSMSLRQAMIPAELLGRVLGAYRVALLGRHPAGRPHRRRPGRPDQRADRVPGVRPRPARGPA